MATTDTHAAGGLTEGIVYVSDSGVELTKVVHWEEEGAHYFRSTDFPFLVEAGETEQEAVNNLVSAAQDFLDELTQEVGVENATEAEREAVIVLLERFNAGYEAIIKRRRNRFIEFNFSKMRRVTRGLKAGTWSSTSPGKLERSEQRLPA